MHFIKPAMLLLRIIVLSRCMVGISSSSTDIPWPKTQTRTFRIYGAATLNEKDPASQWHSKPSVGNLTGMLGGVPHATCTADWRFCRARGFCYSGSDGTLVPEVSDEQFNTVRKAVGGVTACRSPRPVSHAAVNAWQNVRILEGTTLVVNCWKRNRLQPHVNPAHFLMGYANIFPLAQEAKKAGRKINNIVLHQCGDYTSSDWTRYVWGQLTKTFQDDGIWDSESKIGVYVIGRSASIKNGDLSSLPDKHDPIVCAKDIFQDPYHTGMYFGAATKEIMQKWYDEGPASAATRTRPHAPPSPKMGPAKLVHQIIKWVGTKISGLHNRKKAIKGCPAECTQNVRVSIFERQANEGQPRRIVNIKDVKTMITGYTTEPVRTITTGQHTTGVQQAEMFYTTDILISTHGSQLANMVFAQNLSIIEVISIPPQCDQPFCNNAYKLLKFGEVMSFGHTPLTTLGKVDSVVNKVLAACTETTGKEYSTKCEIKKDNLLYRAKNVNLKINLDRLERDLQHVLEVRCGCAAMEPHKSACPVCQRSQFNSSRYKTPPASRLVL